MKISKNFILCVIFVIISVFTGFAGPEYMTIKSIAGNKFEIIPTLLLGISFIMYVLNLIFILPKIKYVRFLMYPMSVCFMFFWIIGVLVVLKNPVIYLAVNLLLFPLLCAGYIWGLVKDIADVKRDQKDGNMFATILFFVVSVIAFLYVAFIVSPFGSKYIFINHLKSFVPIYMWMTIPAYILYVCFCKWVFDKLRKVKFLAYPLMLFNLYCGLMYCMVAGVGDWHVIFFFVIFSIIILLPMMAGAFILGWIQDAQERDKIQKDQNQTSSC